MKHYDSKRIYEPMSKHRLQISLGHHFTGFGFSFLTRVNNPQTTYGDYFLFEITFLWLHVIYTYHYQLPKESE